MSDETDLIERLTKRADYEATEIDEAKRDPIYAEARAAILKLQGEVAEARDNYQRAHRRAADAIRHGIEFENSAEAARQNFHTMQIAANELRIRAEAAEAQLGAALVREQKLQGALMFWMPSVTEASP